jgi:low temperature requirement protein LtrA
MEDKMSLIGLIVTLVIVGVILWAINTYIPMDAKIKNILNVVVVIAVILWLLSAFGVLGRVGDVRIG